MSSQSPEREMRTTIQPATTVQTGTAALSEPSTVNVEEKKSADQDASPVVIEEHVGDDDEDPKMSPFGTALLTGGRKSGPLLAKLSSWGKQANFSNAKDLFAKARFPKAVSSTSVPGTSSSNTPMGGLLGTALESAQLEEASPTAASSTTPRAAEAETEEFSSSASQLPPNSPSRSGSNGPNDSLLDDASSDSGASSSFYSSAYSESLEGGSSTNLKGTFRWAAASVVDSVQTYRGRYAASGNNTPTAVSSPLPLVKSLSTTSATSQTQRILQSRAKDHVAHLFESLAGPHEYIMLLGHGLLGVNLKATYLHNRGVYVDYLVPGGAAATSQIIRPGDLLLRVGDTDVQRSSIYKVPQQIAAAARPVHLVLATGGLPKHLWQMNHVDVVVALLHRFQQQQQAKEEQGATEQQKDECATPSRSNVRFAMQPQPDSPSRLTSDEEDDILHMQGEEGQGSHEHDDDGDDDDSRGAVVAEDNGNGDFADTAGNTSDEFVASMGTEEQGISLVHPTSFDSCDTHKPEQVNSSTAWVELDVPPLSKLWDENYNKDWFELPPPSQTLREQCRTDSARRCSDIKLSASDFLAEGVEGPTLDRALQYALLEVVTDYRKRSFWERHIKTLAATNPDKPPPEALLVLFIELWDFGQYFTFMDDHQRSTTFHRIAHTYFVPTVDDQVGLVPPLIDFHTLVGDTTLRAIEAVLKHQQPLTRHVWRDCFEAALAALARGAFLDFVKSDECARMRGHLRHTAPFWNVPLPTVVELLCQSPLSGMIDTVATIHAKHYAIYLLTYLLCQTDNEGIGELIDLDDEGPRTRIEGAASGFCAALFIKGPWLAAIRSENTEKILTKYNQLWDTHLSPSVGSLAMTSLSAMASTTLTSVLEKLEEIRSQQKAGDETDVCSLLVDDGIVNRIHQLATDLLYDYVRNSHPRFTVHKFHEWMGQEAVKLLSDDSLDTFEAVPRLPPGSIKRFLRKVEFPPGVSSHKPVRESGELNSNVFYGAECAVVFGNSVGLAMMGSMDNDDDTRRYACQSLVKGDPRYDNALQPENIPPTLEAYTSLPLSKRQPMSNYVNRQWISHDGWDVGMVNFVLPRTDVNGSEGGDGSLYGVSLIFQRTLDELENGKVIDSDKVDIRSELCSQKSTEQSPISFEASGMDSSLRKIAVEDCDVSSFNTCMGERTWRERITKEVRPGRTVARIGIALVSQRNALLSMRDVLTALLQDFSRLPGDDIPDKMICGPLIDILGNFAHQDVDASVISSLLRPYLQLSSKKWVDRPIAAQREEFETIAGEQMVNSLPPIAIAMMFVTALLEQKIVITSSRRSLLLSTTTALKKMLQPLKWCHLMVPRVPANLIADLLQYPAPFVLGLPSDEPGVMELIRNLPEEITLVDLDVGRVILAPTFAHANELNRVSSNDSDTSSALRTQVLYLAQSLGSVFGASIDEPLWACDRPIEHAAHKDNTRVSSRFHRLLSTCHDFVEELLAGTTSCCYWIEESTIPSSDGKDRSDPTVFFDEDHFFHIKNKRAQGLYHPLLQKQSFSRDLSLALEDFDLFFELFLRSQSMSTYIGGLDSSLMVYSSQ